VQQSRPRPRLRRGNPRCSASAVQR
jgi:hypothetical protein